MTLSIGVPTGGPLKTPSATGGGVHRRMWLGVISGTQMLCMTKYVPVFFFVRRSGYSLIREKDRDLDVRRALSVTDIRTICVRFRTGFRKGATDPSLNARRDESAARPNQAVGIDP